MKCKINLKIAERYVNAKAGGILPPEVIMVSYVPY